MPQVDFTLEDIKQVIDERLNERFAELDEHLDQRFQAEREHTRAFVEEAVGKGVTNISQQFQSFIDNNFQPALDHLEERFDGLEDRVDHISGDVADLRVGMRNIRHALRARA